MSSWSKKQPCKNCGETHGFMVKCTNCGTLGCPRCVNSPSKRVRCHVCKKSTEVVKV